MNGEIKEREKGRRENKMTEEREGERGGGDNEEASELKTGAELQQKEREEQRK